MIVFDIETVPQESLSKVQEEVLEQKLLRWLVYEEPGSDKEKLKKKIMATNPFLGKIVVICAYRLNDKQPFRFYSEDNEKAVLKTFWDLIKDETYFISFNGLSFDVPFILIRSIINNISITNKKFINTKRFQTDPHMDIMQLLSDWDIRKSPSLKLVCDAFNIKSPKEGIVVAENVADFVKQGKIITIAEYCLNDVMATYEIYLKLKDYFNVKTFN